jgi:hypothetical protein
LGASGADNTDFQFLAIFIPSSSLNVNLDRISTPITSPATGMAQVIKRPFPNVQKFRRWMSKRHPQQKKFYQQSKQRIIPVKPTGTGLEPAASLPVVNSSINARSTR